MFFNWFKPKWDKRQFSRLRSCCLINYSKVSRSRAIEAKETTNVHDISASGLQFTSYEPLAKNSLLELAINLPDTVKPLRACARVVWTKKISRQSEIYRVGVLFLDISEADRKAIEGHIQIAASDRIGKKLILGKGFFGRIRGFF